MGLGAAGCGLEYKDKRCMQLLIENKDGVTTYKCHKYKKELRKNKNIGHPVRCDECYADADKHCNAILAKARNEANIKAGRK